MPPPEWVSNATCYTPRLLDDVDAVAQDDISIADVCKATVILLTAAVTIFANAAFLVVLNTAYYRVVIEIKPNIILLVMDAKIRNFMYKVVQLDLTLEIEVFCIVFDRSISIYIMASFKQHI